MASIADGLREESLCFLSSFPFTIRSSWTRHIPEGTEQKPAQAGKQRHKSARTRPGLLGRQPALTSNPGTTSPDTLLQGPLHGALASPGPSQLWQWGGQQPASQTHTVCASTAPSPAPPPNNHWMKKSWRRPCSPLSVRSCLLIFEKKGKVHFQAGEGVGSCVLSGDCGQRSQTADDQSEGRWVSRLSGRGSAPGRTLRVTASRQLLLTADVCLGH